jgi:glycosyltransferase involved in cell wall biosynthesis
MKVLQLVSSAGLYGAERVVLNLSAGLVAAGCDVTIGTLEMESQESKQLSGEAAVQGFSVKPVYCRGRVDLSAIRQLRRFITDNAIDVVHTHGYKADIYGFAAVQGRSTLVATVHSREPIHKSVKVYTRVDGWALRSFDRIVTVTPQLQQRLIAEGFSAEQVKYIPNGVPIPSARRDVSHKTPVIGVIGRLSHEKGPDLALQAFHLLQQRGVQFQGVFLGDGPLAEELRAKNAALGMDQIVHFPGRAADVAARLAEFTAVLIPSRSEQMPMTLLESMAAGAAVVATRVGSIGTILEHGVTGFLVNAGNAAEMAEALEFVLRDRKKAESAGQQARAVAAAKYSADAMVSEYLQLYRGSVVGKKPALQSIRAEGVQSNG